MGLDANETPAESFKDGKFIPGSMEDLLQRAGLQEVFLVQHGITPDSSTTSSGRFIDRVATHGVDVLRATLLRASYHY